MTNNVTGEEYTKQRFVAVLDIMGFKKIVECNQASVIEMVKRGEIREKKIGGRILYDAAEIDEAVKEKTIFRYKRRKNDIF